MSVFSQLFSVLEPQRVTTSSELRVVDGKTVLGVDLYEEPETYKDQLARSRFAREIDTANPRDLAERLALQFEAGETVPHPLRIADKAAFGTWYEGSSDTRVFAAIVKFVAEYAQRAAIEAEGTKDKAYFMALRDLLTEKILDPIFERLTEIFRRAKADPLIYGTRDPRAEVVTMMGVINHLNMTLPGSLDADSTPIHRSYNEAFMHIVGTWSKHANKGIEVPNLEQLK